MQVRFWGTRGSIAKPGPSTIRYGGNTSCVEVRTDAGELLVIDCGTGAHELSQHLLKAGTSPINGALLISHTHWDHIQGIPFFVPFFIPGNEWDVYAPQGFGDSLRTTLAGQMEYTYFPITPEAFGAKINYHNVSEGVFNIGSVRVVTRFLNHPALTIAYRLEADGAVVVYACDHEPHSKAAATNTGAISGQDEAHSQFLSNADLVIHDAQYTAAEYPAKEGWGHSTYEYAVNVCERAGVRKLALTHHDPTRNDDALDKLLGEARSIRSKSSDLEIIVAAEGQILDLEPSARPAEVQSGPDLDTALTAENLVLVATLDDAIFDRVASAAAAERLHVRRLGSSEREGGIGSAVPSLCIFDSEMAQDDRKLVDSVPDTIPIIFIGEPAGGDAPANSEFISPSFSPEYLRSRIKTWLMRCKYAAVPAAIPEDEAQRLAVLRSLELLDTPAEERFDRITRIATKMFDVPTALITLVDEHRQWFKSATGFESRETSRDVSFCAHAILEPDPMIVPDALEDPRFAKNSLVLGDPRIRFYAGVPIIVNDQPLGTLCLIDTKPRDPSPEDVQALADLSRIVISELSQG